MCERIFGDAFTYEVDEDKAYTMWWFDKTNPNDKTAETLGLTVPDTCGLQYLHKEAPSAEADSFTECHPWKDNACCHNSTVASAETLRKAYGPGYEWDRCGPMSPECSRFFVQEACLYECDVTAGLYRKCSDEEVAAAKDGDACFENTWEMYKMPIKASYCDAWYNACAKDYFCGGGDDPGNFFSCDDHYWDTQEKAEIAAAEAAAAEKAKLQAEVDASLPTYAVVIIVIVVALLFMGCIGVIIKKEKEGKPIFLSLVSAEDPDANQA